MFRRVLLTTTAVVALSGAAFAADLGTRAPPPYVPPVFSWTGFYTGVSVGGLGIHSSNTYDLSTPYWNTTYHSGSDSARATGILGGFDIGYNYQFNNFVLGIEADWSMTSASANADNYNWPTWFGGAGRTEIDSLGTVRGRLGYAIDHTLMYVTGGFAWSYIKATGQMSSPSDVSGAYYQSGSGIASGWTVGGGIEQALTDHFTIRAEGLYAQLGDRTVATSTHGGNCTAGFKAKTDMAVARIGMNYKF